LSALSLSCPEQAPGENVPYSLIVVRFAEAERQAERQFRENVTAQKQRDAVGVTKLSAEAAAGSKRCMPPGPSSQANRGTSPTRATGPRAREAGRRHPSIAAEIDRFEKAAEQRLGGDGGIAALLRSAREGRTPGVEPGQRRALQELARGLAATRRGRLDHQLQRAQDAAEQREHQQQHPRHRHGPSLGR
jgi:hypothetical protein